MRLRRTSTEGVPVRFVSFRSKRADRTAPRRATRTRRTGAGTGWGAVRVGGESAEIAGHDLFTLTQKSRASGASTAKMWFDRGAVGRDVSLSDFARRDLNSGVARGD